MTGNQQTRLQQQFSAADLASNSFITQMGDAGLTDQSQSSLRMLWVLVLDTQSYFGIMRTVGFARLQLIEKDLALAFDICDTHMCVDLVYSR